MEKLAVAVFGNKCLFYKRQSLAELAAPGSSRMCSVGVAFGGSQKQRVHHFLAWRLSSVTAGFALCGPPDF